MLDWFANRVRVAVPNASLDMVGPSGPALPGVFYHAGLTDRDLAGLYRRAWVYASPSSYEGFGLPYLEAMASGTPVVATPNPGSRELLEGGKYGVLADDATFPDAVVGLLKSDSQRAELAERGFVQARRYSLAVTIDRYEELFASSGAPRHGEMHLTNANLLTRRSATRPIPWGMLELFVIVLYMSSALLFIPGAQAFRTPIRAIPYLFSLAMLLGYWISGGRRSGWPGQIVLTIALGILVIGLFHPQSSFFAGIAQVIFQLSIAAPAYWAMGQQVDGRRVGRFLTLLFLLNAASSTVGLLQIYYPDQFMPVEFSRQAVSTNKDFVESLSYVGAGGKKIIRPPGLTDLPGGAGSSCAITALLGVLMAFQPNRALWQRLGCAALAGAGLVTLYLTQIRSMLLMTIFGYATMCLLLARMHRIWLAGTLAGAGFAMVVGGFTVALALGGQAIFDRFYSLYEEGLFTSFRENRGIFLEYTFSNLIYDYPVGAGVGRFGMMHTHFARYDANPPTLIWAEIQPTGWIIDGGIPLLIAYLGAIGAGMWQLYRVADLQRGEALAYPAALVFSANLFMIGQALAGPSFNSTGGITFWLPTTVILAAHYRRRRPIVAKPEARFAHVG